MLETLGVALATLFATIGPLNAATVFAGLTSSTPATRRRQMAMRGTVVATSILLVFALVGEVLLAGLGISLAALRTAGGILLLMVGIDLVFARHSAVTSTTDEEEEEARGKQDISVFPLATPLIAGPGSMGASVLLMANAGDDLLRQAAVLLGLFLIMALTLTMMLLSSQINRLIGTTGMQVIERVMGVLLSALAIQFMFDGIAQSGLLAVS